MLPELGDVGIYVGALAEALGLAVGMCVAATPPFLVIRHFYRCMNDYGFGEPQERYQYHHRPDANVPAEKLPDF